MLKTHFLLIAAVVFTFFVGFSTTALAATTSTDCVITRVGNAPEDQKPDLPPECLSSGGGGRPGQPLPSQDPKVIADVLCKDYKVCPTASDASPSSNGWTLDQLTALWNTVQKIYESSTYTAHAIGNFTLEITRVSTYPGNPGWVWGFHANSGLPNYHEVSGSRLIVVTDLTNEAGSLGILEWFFAHEIAHAASFGSELGDWTPNVIGQNTGYQAVMECGQTVSSYGQGSRDENYADTVAYYMSTGEEVTSYFGGSKNLKTDFPCSYNALKTHYFDGKEF